MQRYKFESNSQRYFLSVILIRRCVYLCKDTNLKAIHNQIGSATSRRMVVFTYAKIQIWKQFTTERNSQDKQRKLCLPMQRYKFESNSQLIAATYGRCQGCVYLCKDTNLKAIHNTPPRDNFSNKVVFTYAKIQIWKQFTTYFLIFHNEFRLCLPMQRYKFESNSQLIRFWCVKCPCCVYLCKDTNLKAIHNILVFLANYMKLCLPMQRYKFESNSQPSFVLILCRICCVYLCKDTNLKAIHNHCGVFKFHQLVVFTYAKIQIWKQFTTT